MLAFLSTALLFAFPVFSLPSVNNAAPMSQNCTVGSLTCCNDLQPFGTPATQDLASGLLNIALGAIGVQAGFDCVPVGVAGGGGQECNAQTACCSDENFNGGLIGLACMPFNLNA
ncbi:hypothetical protein H0H93_006201 [Arthromyces matolae]|nr:hypothetical protein H0H93_006201 [Arthromyces matolae]